MLPDLYFWNSFRIETNAQGVITKQVGTNDSGGGPGRTTTMVPGHSTQVTVTSGPSQLWSRTTNNNDGRTRFSPAM